jgi:hypothetical protein
LVALGDTHTRTIADYVSRLNELEQRSCKSWQKEDYWIRRRMMKWCC